MTGTDMALGSGPLAGLKSSTGSKSRAVWDADDYGASHIISEMCQSHDCRDVLMSLKAANPKFKATLFSIPGEMTMELSAWAGANRDWIELAWHGFFHQSNHECEKMSYQEFDTRMTGFRLVYESVFAGGFKAPGWQISDDIYRWLRGNGFWVADQAYNDERRPKDLRSYVIRDNGWPNNLESESMHFHTWNCVGNGVYELFDDMLEKVKNTDEFLFVSEVVRV